MNLIDRDKLREYADSLKRSIIQMNCYAESGHPGGSLSAVEIVAYLFQRVLDLSPDAVEDPQRDRFILSKGHSCLVLYAALSEAGFFGKDEFKRLRQVDAMLQGHPDRLKTPGVEFNSGSLGQGFSFALGCALGLKRQEIKADVYVLLGDGELNEGQVWEGMMFGAFHKLDNLTAIVDYNKFQSDDLCENITALAPLMDKFRAFGWHAIEIDGHDFNQIAASISEGKNTPDIPTIILAHTIKGKGISFMENNPKWHGSLAPQGEERECALKECGSEDLDL